ncbi:MAG: recombinase family protein [Alteromonadaceae bacterium]|nr:recombinase family protein [Alteromonadaceae bacterium]
MATVGFARVSTIEQDLKLQLDALAAVGCEKIFHGKQSGVSDENEQQLTLMLDYIRERDIVTVTKLDRLGRSLKSILTTIDAIHEKGATLKTLDGVIDTANGSPFAKATVSLIGVFAELERDLIVSRTSEGRAAAALAGKHMGRTKQIPDEDRAKIRKVLLANKSSISEQARQYSVSRTTISRIKQESSV